METRTAKLFMNGASQAVRLPAEFRFSSDEVFISRDATTGDVVLSTRPSGRIWADYFAQLRTLSIPEAFMADRPLNAVFTARGVFDDDVQISATAVNTVGQSASRSPQKAIPKGSPSPKQGITRGATRRKAG